MKITAPSGEIFHCLGSGPTASELIKEYGEGWFLFEDDNSYFVQGSYWGFLKGEIMFGMVGVGNYGSLFIDGNEVVHDQTLTKEKVERLFKLQAFR